MFDFVMAVVINEIKILADAVGLLSMKWRIKLPSLCQFHQIMENAGNGLKILEPPILYCKSIQYNSTDWVFGIM